MADNQNLQLIPKFAQESQTSAGYSAVHNSTSAVACPANTAMQLLIDGSCWQLSHLEESVAPEVHHGTGCLTGLKALENPLDGAQRLALAKQVKPHLFAHSFCTLAAQGMEHLCLHLYMH